MMENENVRVLQIIECLSQSHSFVSTHSLANKLGLSSKTIQSIIKNTMNLESYGVEIVSKIALGYRLNIINQKLFDSIDFKSLRNENETRIHYIISYLISQNDYIKIEELADSMFVSRATIDRCMKEVKTLVEQFQLKIVVKPHYGLKIEGKEKDKRLCIAEYLKHDIYKETMQSIQNILLDVFNQVQFELDDTRFYNLTYHINIAIHRIKNGYTIKNNEEFSNLKETKEYAIAQQLVRQLETHFSIKFEENEVSYISIHLLSKQKMNEQEFIQSHILDCVDLIFDKIKTEKGFNFTQDMELRITLALHIQPMIARLTYGMKQSNPILQKIKRNMIEGYELALIAKRIIQDKYILSMNDDEVSYLALHFSLALEKNKDNKKSKKIIVVCTSGRGVSKLIQYRLMHQYQLKEEDVCVTSYYQLENMNLDGYACILSTIPLQSTYSIPVMLIEALLDDQALKKIDEFLIDCSSPPQFIREELLFPQHDFVDKSSIIEFMCNQIISVEKVEDSFKDEVFKRELLSSTEVGNHVALPHPVVYKGNQVIFSLMILNKAILWNKTKVKFVFLVALPTMNHDQYKAINNGISKCICNQDLLESIEKNCTSANLMDCMFR